MKTEHLVVDCLNVINTHLCRFTHHTIRYEIIYFKYELRNKKNFHFVNLIDSIHECDSFTMIFLLFDASLYEKKKLALSLCCFSV